MNNCPPNERVGGPVETYRLSFGLTFSLEAFRKLFGNKSCLCISERNYNYFEIAAYFVFLTSFSGLALRIHSPRDRRKTGGIISPIEYVHL